MAKILLINPIVREEDSAHHIPYGLSLMAAIAIEKGHQVAIYDENCLRLGDDVVEKAVRADDWDVIGIGGLTTAYGHIKKIVKMAKSIAPNALIVGGGGFITSMPKEIMGWLPEIDLGVIGEAFVTWPEVLAKVDAKDFDFSQTLGVCYRAEGGKPTLSHVRPNIQNMDILPFPAWDLLPLEKYFANSSLLYSESAYTSKRRIDVMGSVGCSLFCKFCWHLGTSGDMVIEKDATGELDVQFTNGRNIRYHSPKYIVKMVKTLVEKYQVDFTSFVDENFMTMDVSSGRTWMNELCKEWIAAGLQPTCQRDGVPHDRNCTGVHWSGTSHASLLLPETLKTMAKAGCSHLVYGLEAFDNNILRNLGKGATAEKNIASVKITLDAGIAPLPNVIIGFPEETFDSVRKMINALLQLGIHAKPHFATPYPGSAWYYTYKQSIIDQYGGSLEAFIEDLGDATKPTAVICHKFSAMELLGLQQIVQLRSHRLLDQAEYTWGKSDETKKTVAIPAPSFNFNPKPSVRTPLETAARASL